MAININILTKFDSKGLRTAKKELGAATRNLKDSTASLGRNFAVLGAGLVGAGALIAKNAESLARIEAINAQTDATIKSMGNTAGITAQQIQSLAGSLEKVTATEAETIQEGANLLLTFKNIKNEAGVGNDIFNQTTTAMVDLARAMGTDASGEAIKLGKALNDPTKGITALTRVGVSFTEEQKNQIKALQQSGDLMGAQKIILAELQNQFGGSGAAYAATFAGQLELMGHELGTVGEEATMAVMPALQSMVAQLRELIPVIGPQLKAAIASVDWEGLVRTVIEFTTFLITNAEAIAKTMAALWLLSTAVKAVQVAMALGSFVGATYTSMLAKIAAGSVLTKAALVTLQSAMLLAGVAVAVYAVGESYVSTKKAISDTIPVVQGLNKEVLTFATMDVVPAGIAGTFQMLLKGFLNATNGAKGYKIEAEKLKGVKFIDHIKGVTDIKTAWWDAVLMKGRYNNAAPAGNAIPASPTTGDKGKPAPLKPGYSYEVLKNNKWFTATWTGKKWNLKEMTYADPSGGGGGGGGGSNAKAEKEAKKAGKSTGQAFSQGVAENIKFNQTIIKAYTDLIVKNTPILDEWKQYGSTIGNAVIEGMRDLPKQINRLAGGIYMGSYTANAIKQTKFLYDYVGKLQDKMIERGKFQEDLRSQIMSSFDFKSVETGIDGIIAKFKKQVEETKNFRDNIKELSKLGLTQDLFGQIVESKDFATAAELVKGGASAITEINALYGELGTFADEISSLAGNQLYNLGVDAATGYIRTLEDGFVDLEKYSKVVLERSALSAALSATKSQLAVAPKQGLGPYPATMTRSELEAQLAKLQAESRAFGQRNRPTFENLRGQVGLDQSLLTGSPVNAPGVGFGGERTITVNVNGGMSTSSEIGRAVVQAISSYERSSGSVYARA